MISRTAGDNDSAGKKTEFDLRYNFSVPGKTQKVRFVAALPRTISEKQKVTVSFDPRPHRIFRKDGNRYAEFIFNNPKGDFEIVFHVKAEILRCDLFTLRKKGDPNRGERPRSY